MGWLLVGDRRVASARLQGWLVHEGLRGRGHRSTVLNEPGSFDTRLRWKAPRRWREAALHPRRALVFQKVESSRAVRLAALARRFGKKIVFAQADPRPSPLYRLAHRVVVSSDELARQLDAECRAPMTVIPDALEHSRELVVPASDRTQGLKLLWVGHRFNFVALEPLRTLLAREEFADMRLVTISDHPDADHPWSRERVEREMADADAAVVPSEDTPAHRAKSNNRLTMFMGVGLPTVATPLPAYRSAATDGEDALLAGDLEAWAAALRRLREPSLRRRLGAAARRTAWDGFSPERILDLWEGLLCGLTGTSRSGGVA